MIKNLLENQELKNWYAKTKQHGLWVDGADKVGGFDFYQNEATFKIYLQLKELLPNSILLDFVSKDALSEIRKFEKFWDSKRESSLAIGLKIDTQENIRQYYHIKFNSDFSEINHADQLTFLRLCGISLKNIPKGISFEMPLNKHVYEKKYYYYIKNKFDIKKVLILKNMENGLDVSHIDELEIYATPSKSKINVVNNNDNYIIKQRSIWQSVPQLYHNRMREAEALLCSPLMYTGKTSEDVYSGYFCLSNTSNTDNLFV